MVGHIVLSVGAFMHADSEPISEEQKAALDELHKRKIDLADEVLVLNVGGYIGSSTRSEIEYAVAHHKPIRYRPYAAAPRSEADADAIRTLLRKHVPSFWDEYTSRGYKCGCGGQLRLLAEQSGDIYALWVEHVLAQPLKGTKLPGEQPGYTDNKALNERLAAENKRLRELATEILRVNQYAERYPITKAEGWRVLVDMTLAALKPEATKERK